VLTALLLLQGVPGCPPPPPCLHIFTVFFLQKTAAAGVE
jgi:hypothetical protein